MAVSPSRQQKNVRLAGFIIVPCADATGADSKLVNTGISAAAQPSVSSRRILTEPSLRLIEVDQRAAGRVNAGRPRFIGEARCLLVARSSPEPMGRVGFRAAGVAGHRCRVADRPSLRDRLRRD